ncbi:SMC-Scp complex subunit ScpB [Candidatus Nomurabacteria bacterium]|nr:SMC-Scp complex subunit ScpB [Candidatus Nomurabacteria bacterium]
MTQTLPQSIEAILFANSEPQSVGVLASRLEVSREDITGALQTLAASLEGHGVSLVVQGEMATLMTHPQYSALIEAIRKEELSKELSKASAETLAIICYHPEATKAQIEFIRGVNASYSLRALQMRGLIEQTKGEVTRSGVYRPTIATLAHFGVTALDQLPQYQETRQKIAALLQQDTAEAAE